MKILLLVSENAGHLDFGGNGFLKIASELQSRGHTLHWLAPKENADRLKKQQFKAATSIEAGNLFLLPFVEPDRIKRLKNEFDAKIQAIRALIPTAKKYDLIICDRLLALAPLLAEKVSKPCVIMGTPDTHFELGVKFPAEVSAPVERYQKVGTAFAKALGLKTQHTDSFWARSNQLNICFTSKDFYQFSNANSSCYVNHFFPIPTRETAGTKIGFSFGNTGEPEKMIRLIQAYAREKDPDIEIEAYAGRDPKLLATANKALANIADVKGWIDFHETFSTLSALVCFGGIGTLWEASNCGVPVATVPDIGDQMINTLAVQRLGLGVPLDYQNIDSMENIEQLVALSRSDEYAKNAARYREASNFSDTIESCCDKIERIAF